MSGDEAGAKEGLFEEEGEIAALRARVAKLEVKCAQERKGRIRAEQSLREGVHETIERDGYSFSPVGVCRSIFRDRRGTPRQGSLAPSAFGWIELAPRISYTSLEGLEQYSHVWVIFVFHKNTDGHKVRSSGTVKSKVRPPVLGGKKVGLYSTRTPHRPNPVGLTLARLVGVELTPRPRIFLSGIDLVDGTPVLDVKPMVPADCVSASEARFASWVPVITPRMSQERSSAAGEDLHLNADVRFSESAKNNMKLCVGKKRVFASSEQAMTVAIDVLRLDIRGFKQKDEDAKAKPEAASSQSQQISSTMQCRLGDLEFDVSRAPDGSFFTVERVAQATD